MKLIRSSRLRASLFAVLASCSFAVAAETRLPAENFLLLDHRGDAFELHRQGDAGAVVLFVTGNGCPIARKSMPVLEEMAEDFAGRGARFVLLNANPQDDAAAVRREVADYDIPFPVLMDRQQLVAKTYGIERTAEAILIDPKTWTVAYRGAVDDRFNYGAERPVKEHFLRNALEQLLNDEPVTVANTRPKGCAITFEFPDFVPDFAKDIAPMLQRSCVPCHSDGNIGPFAMDGHRRVAGWSEMIREVVLTRRMPPWHADPHHGVFANDRSLSDDEVKRLITWIDAGAPRGEGEDPLANAEPEDLYATLGEPDYVIPLPDQQHVPATGLIDYVYRQVKSPVPHDAWVRAAVLRPTNRRVVHHALVFEKYPEHLKDRQPNYDGGTGGYFTGYVPGSVPTAYPADTGKFLPAGSTFIFQMHYTATGRTETDQTELLLYLHRAPPAREVRTGAIAQTNLDIPPHTKAHPVRAEVTLPKDVRLLAFSPHMHFRGGSFHYELITPDGDRKTLLSVPQYDFNWQTLYELKKPVDAPAGSRLVGSGTFDNSAQNPLNPDPYRRLAWGDQSEDEMFIGYFDYVPAEKQDHEVN